MRCFNKTKRKGFGTLLKNKITKKNPFRYTYHKEAKEHPSNPIICIHMHLLSRLLMGKLIKRLYGIVDRGGPVITACATVPERGDRTRDRFEAGSVFPI